MIPERAIILAAGRGTRLKPLSDTMPKPLTEVNGRPILFNALDHLESAGVRTACIVVGHLHEKIIDACGRRRGAMEISYVHNAQYAATNNACSLLKAREFMDGGFLLLEADIFFDYAVLGRLAGQTGSAWAADCFTPAMNGCRLRTEGNRVVQLEIIKQSDVVPPGSYKSAGMLTIDAALADKFERWLDETTAAEPNVFFDLVLGRHLSEAGISICCVNGLRWAEIDDLNDLAEAEKIFRS